MKLLFDENLSGRLVTSLADTYPGSKQVLDIGLGGKADSAVWNYASLHGFVIVSKDSDFYERSIQTGTPPKVVWIRLGNCTTASIELLLRNSEQRLSRFERSEENCLLLDDGE